MAHQAQGTTSMVRRVHSRPHSGQFGGSGLLPGHPLRMTAGRAAQWRQPRPGALVAASMRSIRRAGSVTVGVLSSDGLQGHRYYLDSSLGGAVTGCDLGPRPLRACLDRGAASEPGRKMWGGLSVGVSASDHRPAIASEGQAGQYLLCPAAMVSPVPESGVGSWPACVARFPDPFSGRTGSRGGAKWCSGPLIWGFPVYRPLFFPPGRDSGRLTQRMCTGTRTIKP